MKNWLKMSIFTGLLIGMVVISGCTSTGSIPTPQTKYPQVTVTPTVNTAIAHTHGNYKVGDIVLANTNAFHRGDNMYLVILDVDSAHQAYTYDYIYKDSGATQWYRWGTSEQKESMESFDVSSDYVFDHVDISKIKQK
jgi:predicted component of type VI protein secretion system